MLRSENSAFPHILSTEGRGVGLCWAHSQPKGPKGWEAAQSKTKVKSCFQQGPGLPEPSVSSARRGGGWAREGQVLSGGPLRNHQSLLQRGLLGAGGEGDGVGGVR